MLLSPLRLVGYQVTLRSIEEDDLEVLRYWRNQPQVSRYMLSQETISAAQQRTWYERISASDSELHFVIEYRGKGIGSANLKVADNSTSLQYAQVIEPGLYIADDQYRNNILAFAPTLVLNDYCFDTLKVEKLRAVVYPENEAALKYNQKLGYREVNRGELVEIELNFQDYQQHTKMLKGLLSRPAKKVSQSE